MPSSPGGGGAGNTLTVTLNEPFSFFTPFIGGFFGGDLQISSSATVAVLNSAAGGGTGDPAGCAAPTLATFTRHGDRPHRRARSGGLVARLGPVRDLRLQLRLRRRQLRRRRHGPHDVHVQEEGHLHDHARGHEPGRIGHRDADRDPAAAGAHADADAHHDAHAHAHGDAAGTHADAYPDADAVPTPTATPCTPPTAAFSASPVGNSGKVNFNDQSTYPAGCPITVWLWDFGDGTPLSNAQNPQHTYANKNAFYTVRPDRHQLGRPGQHHPHGAPVIAQMRRRGREPGRGRRRHRGQALVEFALVLPIFVLILFGLIDVGRLVYLNSTLSQAAREGARLGSVEASYRGSTDPACGTFGGPVCPADDNGLMADIRAAANRMMSPFGSVDKAYMKCVARPAHRDATERRLDEQRLLEPRSRERDLRPRRPPPSSRSRP